MAVVRYTKQRPTVYQPKSRVRHKKSFDRRVFWLHRLAPVFLVGVGIILLGSVVFPILSSQLENASSLEVDAAEGLTNAAPVNSNEILLSQKENLLPTPYPTPKVISQDLDYTDLSNWFPEHELPIIAPQEEKKYLLSIPKLGLENAEVVYGGRNLDQHLIQYPGTGMPGEAGSPVIFGHSVLRQFYNPKENNPRRYISIFSMIMTLKPDDEIIIKDEAITYRYKVLNKTEVKPTDRYILDQQTDTHLLKIVTCVPEGTTLRRGVVTATLVE
ncbi:MAG: sortase [Candidatus Woesebacteria bacterium]